MYGGFTPRLGKENRAQSAFADMKRKFRFIYAIRTHKPFRAHDGCIARDSSSFSAQDLFLRELVPVVRVAVPPPQLYRQYFENCYLKQSKQNALSSFNPIVQILA